MSKLDNNQPKVYFTKMNYILLLAGVAIIAVGLFTMVGKTDIYSTTKLTVAPILVLLGFATCGYAIMFRKKGEAGE